MKLIHAKLARSIWLFDILDMNPKGKDILGDLVSWIKDEYDFAVAPDPDNPVPNAAPPPTAASPKAEAISGLTFQRGSFKVTEETYVVINSLTIYDDGIVVDAASSTEDGDRFALDLLQSAARTFELAYDNDTVRKRLYLSELILKSDIDLVSLNPILPKFLETLSAAPRSVSGPPFTVGGISFWSDADGGGRQRVVRLERQSGKAISEKRFFSDAPMETAIHFRVLEEFERLVMGS